MLQLKKFLYKPKRTDTALLAQFYFADEDLCSVAAELDSFDGRRHPARCAMLVAQLRHYQEQVLKIMQSVMDEVIVDNRADRSYRVKYPDDLVQDGLSGQLWFGAECLAAGSNILNREIESACMRPLAKSLTKQLDVLRGMLREQTLRDPTNYTDRIKQSLIRFDRTFAEFELSYVSAMVPVKSVKEYELTQDVTVLFSETVQRSLSQALITSDMIDYYDPSLMFTIPRLAIVTGLVIYPDGPLNPLLQPDNMTEMFRPFHFLLLRIRELLWSLTQQELHRLERMLCNLEEPPNIINCKKTAAVKSHKKRKTCKRTLETQNRSLFRDISDLNITNRPSAIIDNNEETGVARARLLPQTEPQTSGDNPENPSARNQYSFTFNLPTNHNTDGHQVTLNSRPLMNDNEESGWDRTEDDRSSISTTDSLSDLSSFSDIQISDDFYAVNTVTNKTVTNQNQTPDEMMQKLFVCISGVADQLQTNFASDLRNILKVVFELNTEQEEGLNSDKLDRQLNIQQPTIEAPPIWIPDSETENCLACKSPFTFLRRRHHCRNCGMIFCARCSSNEAPLPNFGYTTAVRVCNNCYVYRINPFYSEENPETSSAQINEVTSTS